MGWSDELYHRLCFYGDNTWGGYYTSGYYEERGTWRLSGNSLVFNYIGGGSEAVEIAKLSSNEMVLIFRELDYDRQYGYTYEYYEKVTYRWIR